MPWARPDSGFTLLFEALLMTMVSAMPVKAVARMVGEHDTRLWRVVHHYVEQARARTDASEATRLAIDETAARRGHDYITLFVDIDRARVLFATEGRAAKPQPRAIAAPRSVRAGGLPCPGCPTNPDSFTASPRHPGRGRRRYPSRSAMTADARVHHADDAMARITAERLVWHLRRSGFVVMKRPA